VPPAIWARWICDQKNQALQYAAFSVPWTKTKVSSGELLEFFGQTGELELYAAEVTEKLLLIFFPFENKMAAPLKMMRPPRCCAAVVGVHAS